MTVDALTTSLESSFIVDMAEFRRANDLPALSDRCNGGAIDPSPLVGTWYSTNKATRGISQLTLSERDGVLTLQSFGAWKPSCIDWGPVKSHAFSAGVGTLVSVGFKASYDFGFLQTVVAAYLNKRILVVDTYNTFNDDSGRFNYFLRDHFYQ
jgi:hypothetical protein